ncbi:ABC transporter B family member 19 [Selaginella moellendorffii]|uniref:ABC transporter B family member 19 n=1 Tax=Selaginella moellendorffii TaxID=88036 RepID=UPI000D1CBEE4|nr:ABC transporter B family member 19 [Selaginella moellendorffii]|eukprot:XP_024523774.1 ABC transporter B family member 19 [Selaginella moellendorffii]
MTRRNVSGNANASGSKSLGLNSDGPPSSLAPLHKLFFFADRCDHLLMALGSLGAIAHGLALPIFFFSFGRLAHVLGSDKDLRHMYHSVSKVALDFLYLGLILFGASWLEVACWIQTGERQCRKIRISYLEAILRHDISFFDRDDARTGELVSSISSNTLLIQQAISEKMGVLIHHVSTFFGGIALGFATVWQLGLLTLATVPVVILAGGLYAHVITGVSSKTQKEYDKAGNIVEGAISQIRTVYSFVGEQKTISLYTAALGSTLRLGYRAGLVKGIGMGAMYALPLCSWALLMWYGGILVRNRTTNGGKALSTIFCVLLGAFALGQTAPTIAAISNARAAAFKILETLDNKNTITNCEESTEFCLQHVRGELELNKVTFNYPSRPDARVLHDLSGKSTIISLIERFYDPSSGEILLDGYNTKSLQLKWLRSQIGLVNQEPALFATTIAQNILYGKDDANMEEIKLAARTSNAHDFINQLPQGYETQVGSRGLQLSGGQKQRIAIARALVRNPAILLLDEATSALDAESENVVQDAVDKIMVARTTVIIAHRLCTLKGTDSIAVLQNGRLVETGSHQQLIADEKSLYSGLVRLEEARTTEATSRLSNCSSSSFRRLSSVDDLNSSTGGSFRLSKLNGLSFTSREDEENVEADDVLKKFVTINLPDLPFLVLGTIGAVCSGLPNPAYSFLVSKILDVYYYQDFEEMKRHTAKYSVVFVMVAVGAFVAFFVQYYSFGIAGENLTMRVRKMMLSGILRNEISWFDREEHSSSQLASRLASDAVYMKSASGDILGSMVQNVAVIVASFAIAFLVEWRVAIVVAATFPFIVLSTFAQKLFLQGLAGDLERSHSRASMLAGDAVSNIRTIAAFNAEKKLVNLVTLELQTPAKRSLFHGSIVGLGYGFSTLSLFGSYGLGLWYGAVLVKASKSSPANVLQAFLVLVMAAFPIADSLAMLPDISKTAKSFKSVFELLDRATEMDLDGPTSQKLIKLRGDIELRDIHFAYPSRPEVAIFAGLNLKIRAGRSLALVGPSGSGKSSVIALVERFYDPFKGMVLVDGRDVKKLNVKAYRRHVGLVQQEPALFGTSICENIAYGKESASEAEIVAAAKAANAHEFISSLPDGYATNVGERGVQLSGGQKQRVAIARAVLKNPAILLLDEATSALDAESERTVQEALERLMEERTTVVVAHRLSTICSADQIAVLHDGEIVEQGRHSELVAKRGAYAQLIKLQSSS